MKNVYIWLCVAFALSACCTSHLTVQSDYLTIQDLASYYVDTPDPRRNCPTVGQRLIVSWTVPKDYLSYENLRLEITIRFRNREEVKEIFHLTKTRGTYVFTLLNDDYFSKRGILTYKIDLIGNEMILEEWRHKIWADLIQLQAEEATERQEKQEATSEALHDCTEEDYPINWKDEPL